MGCHSFLQGIFPTQRWNLGLPHCRQTHYCWATREEFLKKICARCSLTLLSAIFFFFALSPQAREKKKTTKNKQMGLYQILKNSFIVKGTINKTKSSPSEWEKIFANDISNKKILKIHKQHITQNQRNKNLVIPSTSKYSFLVVAFLQSKFAESNKKYSFFVSHSQNHGKTCVNNFDLVFSLYFFSGRIFPQTSNHSS